MNKNLYGRKNLLKLVKQQIKEGIPDKNLTISKSSQIKETIQSDRFNNFVTD
jgi:hypothetical protein